MGGVFYEDGFFGLEDAGGEVGWEGVDDGEGRGGGVCHIKQPRPPSVSDILLYS